MCVLLPRKGCNEIFMKEDFLTLHQNSFFRFADKFSRHMKWFLVTLFLLGGGCFVILTLCLTGVIVDLKGIARLDRTYRTFIQAHSQSVSESDNASVL